MTNRLKVLLAAAFVLALPALTWAADCCATACKAGCCPLCR
jgi:hypothetical protein